MLVKLSGEKANVSEECSNLCPICRGPLKHHDFDFLISTKGKRKLVCLGRCDRCNKEVDYDNPNTGFDIKYHILHEFEEK